MYKYFGLLFAVFIALDVTGQPCPLLINYDAAGNRVYRGNDCDPTCSLLVTTTADDGVGSLRRAIACATEGDTILFAAAVIGQFISLTTGAIPVNKSIYILQTNATKVKVKADGTGPVFDFVAGDTGLRYVALYGSDEIGKLGRAVINRGDLLLEHTDIYDLETVEGAGASLVNYGQLEIRGTTRIIIAPTF